MKKSNTILALCCALYLQYVQGAGWSNWLNLDFPSGKGDFETTPGFRKEGRLPCENPSKIECRTVGSHIPAFKTGQVFHKAANCSVQGGLACYNEHQRRGRCLNYEVKYFCPEEINPGVGWSEWLNRDLPGGYGDFETTPEFRKEERLPCKNPSKIECRTVGSHIPAFKTGQVFHKAANCSVEWGLACYNKYQRRGRCLNYEVRYFCPEESHVCPEPESHLLELPRGCHPRTYDVKKCSGSPCETHKSENKQEYCCGPILQETVVVECDEEKINVVVTKRCGCIVCNQWEDPTTGDVSTQDKSVIFYGRAFCADDNRPLIFGEVLLGGTLQTYTGFTGEFQFKVPQGQTRVVINVRESQWFRQNLIPTNKVFHIPTGYIGAFYRDIPMMKKTEPKQIDSMTNTLLTIATVKESDDPFVQIRIPSGQFVDNRGESFTGKVNAFMNFVDPRDLSSINSMVGDLTYEDEDGNTGPLQTSGMFRLGFETIEGNEVKLKGRVDAAIRADFIDQTLDPPVQVYTFDENSGRWRNPTKLEKVSSRQKRSKEPLNSTFLVGNTVITDRYWINFDNPTLNFCFINMRLYTDTTFSTEIPWTSSTDLTVIALGSMPGAGPSWNMITTGGMSLEYKSGVKTTKNCVMTVCGPTKIHAYLFAENQNGALKSTATLGGSSPIYNVVNNIPAFTGAGPATTHNNPIETNTTLGSPGANTNGPVYHSINNHCESSTYCSTNCPDPANPRCNLCVAQRCQYHSWWSSVRCQEATPSDPHYRFYRDPLTLYEYSVCLTIPPFPGISQGCPSSQALWPLVWFPKIPPYWAWYIKVRVLVGASLDESSVKAASKDSSTLSVYGIREDTTTSRTVCLEFKGSGPKFPNGTATTVVELDVQGTGCVISNILPTLNGYRITPSSHLFAFSPPLNSTHGGVTTGLYFADETAMTTAKAVAKARCECSNILLGSPSCGTPTPSTGVGLTVTCQPTPTG